MKSTRAENLAFIFQETLTAIVRLRSNREQANDAQTFRAQIRETLRIAQQAARARGYSDNTVNLAIFAVVAFLDESILNIQNPVFANWPSKPLQEELFGGHMAGETFFENLRRLLAQVDSAELGDLLEVYQVCILLGYRGRYGIGGQGELVATLDALREKIKRIRGEAPDISPAWAPPDEVLPSQSDPWLKRLLIAVAACGALVLVLYIGFSFSLGSAVSNIRSLNTESRRSVGQ
jgi:type VI secretion system protein ImpK